MDFVTFTEEILTEKLHFLCSECCTISDPNSREEFLHICIPVNNCRTHDCKKKEGYT